MLAKSFVYAKNQEEGIWFINFTNTSHSLLWSPHYFCWDKKMALCETRTHALLPLRPRRAPVNLSAQWQSVVTVLNVEKKKILKLH